MIQEQPLYIKVFCGWPQACRSERAGDTMQRGAAGLAAHLTRSASAALRLSPEWMYLRGQGMQLNTASTEVMQDLLCDATGCQKGPALVTQGCSAA